MEDQRFAHIAKDPKFRRIPKDQTKIKIDKRFQSMFKDKKFQVKYTTDKRGRPVSHSSREDLKRYYHISSEESDSESDNDTEVSSPEGSCQETEDSESNEVGKFVRPPKTEFGPSELEVPVKSDKKLPDSVKKKLKNLTVDYARGESTLLSESSSDDDTGEEVSDTEDVDHKWGELDADAEKTDAITHRLAACNMDWDRIRALDLMVLFNSFLPPGGVIKSVVIYPSEFGKQRMQEEDMKGPIELTSKTNIKSKKEPITDKATDDTGDQNNEEGSKYHMEKLRQYQLNRLKYYYAVITFDSPNSANKIYAECDGMEYESSATKMDLRFIPKETSFDGDEIKEKCDKLPELNKYKPRFFTTTALQQAKVDLTWDETDPDRLELAEKINSGKLDEISDKDLQNYLAGSSSEEENSTSDAKEVPDKDTSDLSENEEENVTDKYKLLLQEIQKNEDTKKNKDVEMEITWGINLKEKTDQIMQNKLTETEEKAPFQKYLDKRKEKRKEKRQKKKNSESEEDIPMDIDMNDPYFAEEFDNSEFKTSKNKKGKVSKSKQNNNYDNTDDEASGSKDKELELLLEDEDDGKKHFSLKKIQEQESKDSNKKKKRKKKNDKSNKNKNEDEFKVNVEDERFSALFTSHHYNIDPTDSHYKKTKAMETLISEKLKRRDRNSDDFNKQNGKKDKLGEDNTISNKRKSSSSELSLLVKSVKRKADGFKSK